MSGNIRLIRFSRTAVVAISFAAAAALVASASWAQSASGFAGSGLNAPRASAAQDTAKKAPPLTLSAGEGDKRLNEWKVYGRYQFSETWGAELNYSDWGKRNTQGAAALSGAPNTVARGSQINLAATGTVPITPSLSLYGKLGYGRNEVTGASYCLSAACGPLAGARSEGARAGVGLRYSFSDSWGLRFDYENVNSLNLPNTVPAKGDSWSARIKYTF